MEDQIQRCKDLIIRVIDDPEEDVCDEVFDALKGRRELAELSRLHRDLARVVLGSKFREIFVGSSVHHILPVEEQKALGFTSTLTETEGKTK